MPHLIDNMNQKDVVFDTETVFLLFELCNGGDMQYYMDELKFNKFRQYKFKESQAKRIFY